MLLRTDNVCNENSLGRKQLPHGRFRHVVLFSTNSSHMAGSGTWFSSAHGRWFCWHEVKQQRISRLCSVQLWSDTSLRQGDKVHWSWQADQDGKRPGSGYNAMNNGIVNLLFLLSSSRTMTVKIYSQRLRVLVITVMFTSIRTAMELSPDQCTNNMELDQSLLYYNLQVTHRSCQYALNHQQFHQPLALAHQPTTNYQVNFFVAKLQISI